MTQVGDETAGIEHADKRFSKVKVAHHSVMYTVFQYIRYLNWSLIGLIAVLLTTAGMRLLIWYDVFRAENIVSPANDPYYYRYVQAEMLEHADGITDIGTLTELGEEGTRPLTHVIHWWIPELFGESQTVADWTAAVLPVILAILAGGVIYMLAVTVTEDARVGILAVLFYAIAPVHLVYTSVGFIEHRAHQYFWLLVLAFSLAWFGVDLRRRLEHASAPQRAIEAHLQSRRTWVVGGVFTLAVALTPHFWGGSPLHFLPVAGYIALRVILDVRNDIPPLRSLTPVLVGLGVGGILAYIPHYIWGWRPAFAVLTPLAVFGGGIAVALYATAGMQRDISPTRLLAGEVGIAAGGIVAFRIVLPSEFSAAWARVGDLLFREGAVETGSLFTSIQRPLLQIGPSFYLGIIGIVIGILVVNRDYRPAWLLLTVFGTFYLLLATLQIRFAAQLVLFISIFGAIATLYLLTTVDLVRQIRAIKDAITTEQIPEPTGFFNGVQSPTLPDRLYTGFIIGVVILALFSGAFLGLGPILDDITHGERYDAAMEFNAHAEEFDREYPDNFVLSSWGNSRMYNYFVSGEARSYGYAAANFSDFMSDTDPDAWHDAFDGRVGYVVAPPVSSPEGTVHQQLWGDAGLGNSSVSHYQYLGQVGGQQLFAVVEGATIRVEGTDDSITAQLSNDNTYTVSGTVENNTGEVTVAYAGDYTVVSDGTETELNVTTSQVYEGDVINVTTSAVSAAHE